MKSFLKKALFLSIACFGFIGLAQAKNPDNTVLRKLAERQEFAQFLNNPSGFFDYWVEKNIIGQNKQANLKSKSTDLVKIKINGAIEYSIEIQGDAGTQTITFNYQGTIQNVARAVTKGFITYAKEQNNGPSEILNAPSADEAAAKFENYAEATLAETILDALKQADIVDENVTVVESPGFFRRVWNVLTSKWVTIPVGLCAAAVSINVMCTLAK